MEKERAQLAKAIQTLCDRDSVSSLVSAFQCPCGRALSNAALHYLDREAYLRSLNVHICFSPFVGLEQAERLACIPPWAPLSVEHLNTLSINLPPRGDIYLCHNTPACHARCASTVGGQQTSVGQYTCFCSAECMQRYTVAFVELLQTLFQSPSLASRPDANDLLSEVKRDVIGDGKFTAWSPNLTPASRLCVACAWFFASQILDALASRDTEGDAAQT